MKEYMLSKIIVISKLTLVDVHVGFLCSTGHPCRTSCKY